MARKVTDAETLAWERKQRVAGMVRTGEATMADYYKARTEWLETRKEAHRKERKA